MSDDVADPDAVVSTPADHAPTDGVDARLERIEEALAKLSAAKVPDDPKPQGRLERFIARHGRPFVALACAFFAWVNANVAVYLQGLRYPTLQAALALASAGILTGMAAAYAGFAAFVKARAYETPVPGASNSYGGSPNYGWSSPDTSEFSDPAD